MKQITKKIESLQFLLTPWWEHGRMLLIGNFVSAVVFSPISGYFAATLAQAVIDKIQTDGSFKDAFLVGAAYLTISLFFSFLRALIENLYYRWKSQEIEGRIEMGIYERALSTDYQHFDNPNYYDSYKIMLVCQ